MGNDLETNKETTFSARQRILNTQVYVAVTGYFVNKHVSRSHGNGCSTTLNCIFYAVHAEML
jgi:hypothetical protein